MPEPSQEAPPTPPPPKTTLGRVDPDGNDEGVHSKYVLRFRLSNGVPLTLNINADTAVPTFRSTDKALTLTWREAGDVTGFPRFKGVIGEGTLNISLGKGVTIAGPIEGGPTEAQTFVGAGTWLSG